MSKTFNYNAVATYTDSFEVESLGNVCLEAIDNLDMHYFLIVRTLLGESTILEYGPLVLESDLLPDNTSITFTRMPFKEYSIVKLINNFTRPRNKGKNKIERVNVVDLEYAISCGINPFEYISNFSDTSNY